MLLAAGLGTRLRPLTDHTPKALVEVAGVPMLERVVQRLLAAGVDRLIVNVHHLGEQIERYVQQRGGWGVEVAISHEPGQALETGGALRYAAHLFRGDAPFFLHNADILTDLPLGEMYRAHAGGAALATLATMERASARYLLFDQQGLLGRADERRGLHLQVREPRGEVRRLAFGGVHVIDPRLLHLLQEQGAFSILDPYLRLAAAGERILPFRVDGYRWTDIGTPDQLQRAQHWDAEGG